ncbi:DNA polymerase nu-like [Amphiura filiformis]|uniref:DNA polymerase nu-like n=1 Tax=Amphiura filiformis TaxID=82378 RepID=UPI003B216546
MMKGLMLVEGNPRKRKVSSSSFQTPFKDASIKKHQGGQTKQISIKQMMEKEPIASHSVRDSFTDVSKMSHDDRILLEERLKKASEVVMTLMYKDKSSQLREISQTTKKEVDDGIDSIAVSITHSLATPNRSDIAESREGSCQQLQQWYVLFPLDGGDGQNDQWSRDMFLSLMESGVRKICFDAQELMHTLMTHYKLQPFEMCCKWEVLDPKVAAWLLDPDHPPITFSDVLDVIKKVDRKTLQSDVKLTNLVQKDLTNLSTAMEVLYQQLKKHNLWDLFSSVEAKLTPILAAMEVQGIGVNVRTLKDYGKRLRDKIDELEDKAHKAAGCVFQVSSHVQLRQVLFDQLKLDQNLQGQKLARTNVQNLKSTSEAVLVKLQDFHPLPKIVLEYRQLMKLNSTYVDGLLEFVNNGTLHTSWEQTSASTGRVQSASPNIQNIPKQAIVIVKERNKDEMASDCFSIWAREPFTSQEGCTFIAADFQSIELRLLAHMSGDPVLLKVFNNKHSQDVFVDLASEWLGMKTCDVTTADREKTKRIVYSVIYGVGPEKLAETLAVSKDEAKTFMKSFLNKFKGVSSFSHRCISSCQRHNGVIRTIFNRLRLIPNINSSNFHARSYAERQAVNFVVQGSAADICKIAMIQVMHKLATMPHLKARLLVQIHDELLLEVPDQHLQELKDILKTVMEATATLCGPKVVLKVPLPVSVSEGKTWGHLT